MTTNLFINKFNHLYKKKSNQTFKWNLFFTFITASQFVFLDFSYSQVIPEVKLDSISKAKFDSIPEAPNTLFSEFPDLKPFMDSAFASYFKNRGPNFHWENSRYPLKLNRKYFDLKLKKNEEATKKKNSLKYNENEDSIISEDRLIQIELFKGENVELVCDSIKYDGLIKKMVWRGHVKDSKGSSASIYFDKPTIFIRIRMLERAPFTIASPFDSGFYILQQSGPSLYPVDYLGSPLDHHGR